MTATQQVVITSAVAGKDLLLDGDNKFTLNAPVLKSSLPAEAELLVKASTGFDRITLSDLILSGLAAIEPKANRPSLINPLDEWFEVAKGSPVTAYPANWQILNGSVNENAIANEVCPDSKIHHVWKCYPSGDGGADGGFNNGGGSKLINPNNRYRISAWVKRNTTLDGNFYLGIKSGTSDYLLTQTGLVDNNPYFLVTDPPVLDQWVLAVGYVHPVGYTSSSNLGGMYTRATGLAKQPSGTVKDFTFAPTATELGVRAYYYYSSTAASEESNTQYLWNPRIDLCDGNEPSIAELLYFNDSPNVIALPLQAPISNRAGYQPLTATVDSFGIVNIAGSVSMTNAGLVSVLPEYLRPAGIVSVAQASSSTAMKHVEIRPNGDIVLVTSGSISWLGVHASYPAHWATFKENRL